MSARWSNQWGPKHTRSVPSRRAKKCLQRGLCLLALWRSAILRRMRLRTASALDAHGVQPDVHWTSGCSSGVTRQGALACTETRTLVFKPAGSHPHHRHQIKMPPQGWVCALWRDCVWLALLPRASHLSLRERPPCGRPARAVLAGVSGSP